MLFRSFLFVAFCAFPSLIAHADDERRVEVTTLFYCVDEPSNTGLVAIGLVMHDIRAGRKTREDLNIEEEKQILEGRCFQPSKDAPIHVVRTGGYAGSNDYPYAFFTYRLIPSEHVREGSYELSELQTFPLIHIPLIGLRLSEEPGS